MNPKIAYFGTPDFSATLLEKLLSHTHKNYTVPLVITRSDKPVGRKKILTPSPVKKVAQTQKIEVCHDLSQAPSLLKKYTIDLVILFAYGKILKKDLLDAPRFGFWNIHPSLLPLYRGASPLAYALMMGETTTGVSVMQMDEKLDHGPIIAQKSVRIEPDDIFDTLMTQVVAVSSELLTTLLTQDIPSLTKAPQEHGFATHTRLLKRDDGYITPKLLKKAIEGSIVTVEELPLPMKEYIQSYLPEISSLPASKTVHCFYRGMHPWPGVWTYIKEDGAKKRCKLTLLNLQQDTLSVHRIQIEGKKEIEYKKELAPANTFFGI